jgi:hydrogenase expression/formation protein HypE
VIVNGTIADHGVAILSVREGLEFETALTSDSAPLHDLMARALEAAGDGLHVARDPTRGGVASVLHEIAGQAGVGILLEERRLPYRDAVRGACEILGLDPLYVANEGKCLLFVSPQAEGEVLAALRAHPLGREAAVIGEVVGDHAGQVRMRSAIGGTRVVDLLVGEPLPRIC